jgi:NADH dehydrogenase FAD-containing subunit
LVAYADESFFNVSAIGNAVDMLSAGEDEEVNDDEGIPLVKPSNLYSLDQVVMAFGAIDDYIKVNGVPEGENFKAISMFRHLKQAFEAHHQKKKCKQTKLDDYFG